MTHAGRRPPRASDLNKLHGGAMRKHKATPKKGNDRSGLALSRRTRVWAFLGVWSALAACGVVSDTQSNPNRVPTLRRSATLLQSSDVPGDVLRSADLASPGVTPGATGGAFDVTPDGEMRYRIPIWTPEGRNGIQPNLSLAYRSRGPNGLLGVGWSL